VPCHHPQPGGTERAASSRRKNNIEAHCNPRVCSAAAKLVPDDASTKRGLCTHADTSSTTSSHRRLRPAQCTHRVTGVLTRRGSRGRGRWGSARARAQCSRRRGWSGSSLTMGGDAGGRQPPNEAEADHRKVRPQPVAHEAGGAPHSHRHHMDHPPTRAVRPFGMQPCNHELLLPNPPATCHLDANP